MSNLFGQFLGVSLSAEGWLKDQAHASAVYRDDNLYDLAPKAGWIYYVRLGINPDVRAQLNKTWASRFMPFVGLLTKSVDLPKFKITTETVNQYNRKSVVQTKLNYESVTLTFHDDNANATTNLWRNYYAYYCAEGNDSVNSNFKKSVTTPDFSNNKYDTTVYPYGFANGANAPFFNSIDIYLLNKQRYTLMSLINPVIKEWQHGQVDQNGGSKMLDSRMTIDYETVLYRTGSASSVGFSQFGEHYDRNPSPLSIAGGGTTSLFGPGGVIPGASQILGEFSDVNSSTDPFELIQIAGQTANLVRNASKLTAAQIRQEGYSVLQGQLQNLARVGFGGFAGGLLSTGMGAAAVNLFTDPTNTSVTGGIGASSGSVPANLGNFQRPQSTANNNLPPVTPAIPLIKP